MSDFTQKFDEAKAHLRPVDWSGSRIESVRSRIHLHQRRFTLSTVALGSAAIAVAIAVAIAWYAQGGTSVHEAVVSADQVELPDGTRAVPLGSDSSVRLLEQDEKLVSFVLEAGKGWFEVTPSATRRVQVVANDVRLEVLGTEFVVEIQGDLVHVWVRRGKVKVSSEAGTVVLLMGEHQSFRSRDEKAKRQVELLDAGIADAATQVVRGERDNDDDESVEGAESDARADTRAVAPEDSPVIPGEAGATPVTEAVASSNEMSIDALWNRADAARRRGNYDDAISALSQLLNEHSGDPRSALAAFSLGRTLIDSGRSPAVAARAFAKARKLSPDGPLVEDALLREIEAWHDAGDARRVRRRSDKYLHLFPQGRYRSQVLQLKEGF